MSTKLFWLCMVMISCRQERSRSTAEHFGIELGLVDSRLAEASGLVASINNPGFFWTINDSGNPSEVFLIDQHAAIRLVCKLNVKNRDWEDIAIDAGPDGKNYLYVADIGDNNSQHRYKMIYRFEEPILSKAIEKAIPNFDTFVLSLPDGKRDAETILIDPNTHDLFIISKDRDSARLYLVPHLLKMDTLMVKKIESLKVNQIVAGSITADGKKVLLKNYSKIYLWQRTGTEDLAQVLMKVPVEVPYQREQQGEAIAWSRDGTKFYTLSESTFGRKASLIVH